MTILMTIILIFSLIQLIVILALANFIVRLANRLEATILALDDLSQVVSLTNRRRPDQGLMDISTSQVPYDERLLRP